MSDEKTSEVVSDPFAGHTAGPWRVNEDNGQIGDVWSVDPDAPVAHAQMIGSMGHPDHDARRANSRLIAAAPSLLAENIELKRQLTLLQVARSSDFRANEVGREIERDLQAKEVKALLDVCRRIVSEYESEGEVSIGCIEDARAAIAKAEGRE